MYSWQARRAGTNRDACFRFTEKPKAMMIAQGPKRLRSDGLKLRPGSGGVNRAFRGSLYKSAAPAKAGNDGAGSVFGTGLCERIHSLRALCDG